jgi:hypothetical protein
MDGTTPDPGTTTGRPGSDRERSAELLSLLRGHFVAPDDPFEGRTFLTELTAPGSNRRADAVWVGLYQSRGYGIDVCELKVSRSDFEREVAHPGKAEAWWPYSSRFWIVAPDTDVAPADRLVDGWGLLVPKKRGRRFKVEVPAAVREPVVDFELLARVMARANSSFQHVLAEERRTAREEVIELQRRHHEQLAEAGADHEAQSRLRALAEFEEACGMQLAEYRWREAISGQAAGRAFRRFAEGEAAREQAQHRALQRLRSLSQAASALASEADRLAGTYQGDD